MVVSTTLKELQSGAGHAVTGGGTLLPMRFDAPMKTIFPPRICGSTGPDPQVRY